jgi:hypothetical protein
MSKLRDLVGQRFGKLTVLARAGNGRRGHARWLCECDCNNRTIVRGADLGRTRSCGCFHKETVTTHGMHKTSTYGAYRNAKERCTNPKTRNYRNYGGRGIRFLYTSFEQFLSDLGGCPPGLTLGRINNDGNYEPGNCRWESDQQQLNNTRQNRLVTILGRTETLAIWARALGISWATLRSRLKSAGDHPEWCMIGPSKYVRFWLNPTSSLVAHGVAEWIGEPPAEQDDPMPVR